MKTEKKAEVVTTRLDEKTRKLLEKVATIKRRNTSDLVRIIIEDYLKNFEDINFTS